MGASMQGPDYVQSHGFYEVAKIFYGEFLPEAEVLLPGVTHDVKGMPEHQWLNGLTPQEELRIRQYYRDRYKFPRSARADKEVTLSGVKLPLE